VGVRGCSFVQGMGGDWGGRGGGTEDGDIPAAMVQKLSIQNTTNPALPKRRGIGTLNARLMSV
jgi:hypothetical protein